MVSKFLTSPSFDSSVIEISSLKKDNQECAIETKQEHSLIIKTKTRRRKSNTTNRQEQDYTEKKILRNYKISKEHYIQIVKLKLDSESLNNDISEIIRNALELFLVDVLNGENGLCNSKNIVTPKPIKGEMLQKGFYLTERLVNGIKTFSYLNKVTDSDVVRTAISEYLKKKKANAS